MKCSYLCSYFNFPSLISFVFLLHPSINEGAVIKVRENKVMIETLKMYDINRKLKMKKKVTKEK